MLDEDSLPNEYHQIIIKYYRIPLYPALLATINCYWILLNTTALNRSNRVSTVMPYLDINLSRNLPPKAENIPPIFHATWVKTSKGSQLRGSNSGGFNLKISTTRYLLTDRVHPPSNPITKKHPKINPPKHPRYSGRWYPANSLISGAANTKATNYHAHESLLIMLLAQVTRNIKTGNKITPTKKGVKKNIKKTVTHL